MKAGDMPKVSKPVWTDKEKQTLLDMKKAGCGNAQIAERLGRSANAVRLKLRQLGHGKGQAPKWTQEELKKLKEFRDSGMTWDDVAKAIGRTKTACQGRYTSINNQTKLVMTERQVPEIRAEYKPGDRIKTPDGKELQYIRTIDKRRRMHVFKHPAGYIETFTDAQLV